MELTRFSGRTEKGRYSVYSFEDREVRVNDSALVSLRLISLYQREDIDPLNKERAAFELLFVNPDKVKKSFDDPQKLLAHLAWELCGLDLTGTHEIESKGEKAFDWDKDAQIIKTSLYQAYGVPWEELSAEVTYRDIASMMGMIPHETPLGQAIYYRTAEPPERTKYNEEQVKQWKERAAFWSLDSSPQNETERTEALNNQMSAAFEAMKRRANYGRGR